MSAEIKNRPQDLWGIAIRECWNKGVLEQGSVGTRGCWNKGVLEQGSTKQGRGGEGQNSTLRTKEFQNL